jgi:DNA-binding MarR family transcriptional regulator
MALLARDAWVAPKQVSEVTGIDKGAVSRGIVALKAAGIAEVRPDSYDRRGQVVALTRRGLRLHDRMVRLARERERILLSGLSKKERLLLVQLLARIESQLPLANAVSRDSRGKA